MSFVSVEIGCDCKIAIINRNVFKRPDRGSVVIGCCHITVIPFHPRLALGNLERVGSLFRLSVMSPTCAHKGTVL